MDFEKAYKNLVAKVKNAHLYAQTDSTKNVLEDILPELRESEDERIRKELIQFLTEIKNISEGGRDSWHVRKEDAGMCDSFISYLEKQKESLHVPETCEETAVSLTGEDEGIVDWLYEMLKRGLENAPKDCPDNPIAEKALAWLEKRKEQKPAEINVKALLAADRLASTEMTGRLKERSVILENPEKYGLQKPAEWGEEDERIRAKLLSYFNGFKESTSFGSREVIEIRHWLKSISPRQNPIVAVDAEQLLKILPPKPEWSEEDEKILEHISNVIDANYAGADWQRMIDWLNNLRPQPRWKPSEDEERLINTSISFLKDFADKGYENAVECIDWLKSKLNGNTCK